MDRSRKTRACLRLPLAELATCHPNYPNKPDDDKNRYTKIPGIDKYGDVIPRKPEVKESRRSIIQAIGCTPMTDRR